MFPLNENFNSTQILRRDDDDLPRALVRLFRSYRENNVVI